MYKNVAYKKIMAPSGFTLIEVQIYLLVTFVMVVMLTHVVLVYKNLYDNTFIRAQESIELLVAMRKINDLSDTIIHQNTSEYRGKFPVRVQKKTLVYAVGGNTFTLLKDVVSFDVIHDVKNNKIRGITYRMFHKNKIFTWYHAIMGGMVSC